MRRDSVARIVSVQGRRPAGRFRAVSKEDFLRDGSGCTRDCGHAPAKVAKDLTHCNLVLLFHCSLGLAVDLNRGLPRRESPMSNRFKKTRPPQFETDGRKLRARRGTKASSGSTNTQRNDLPSDLPWSIQMVAPDHLKRSPRNTRVHPKTQISQIVNSIHEFGYTNPPLVDERNKIIGGHARIEAAQCAGLERIPVIVIPGLSEVKKRALALADNRIAENAGWDRAHLARELSELGPLLLEAGLDIDLTGFEPAQVDALINDHVDPERDPIDELPEISREPVSQKGDLWLLGKRSRGEGPCGLREGGANRHDEKNSANGNAFHCTNWQSRGPSRLAGNNRGRGIIHAAILARSGQVENSFAGGPLQVPPELHSS